jgi:hypothetical protein
MGAVGTSAWGKIGRGRKPCVFEEVGSLISGAAAEHMLAGEGYKGLGLLVGAPVHLTNLHSGVERPSVQATPVKVRDARIFFPVVLYSAEISALRQEPPLSGSMQVCVQSLWACFLTRALGRWAPGGGPMCRRSSSVATAWWAE